VELLQDIADCPIAQVDKAKGTYEMLFHYALYQRWPPDSGKASQKRSLRLIEPPRLSDRGRAGAQEVTYLDGVDQSEAVDASLDWRAVG
jgi:hypothetical protein